MNRLFTSLLIITTLCGCAELPQPVVINQESSASASASILVEGYIIDKFESVYISCADGQDLWRPYGGYKKWSGDKRDRKYSDALPVSILVSPGYHGIVAHFSRKYAGFTDRKLWLLAEAGHVYKLQAYVENNSVTIKIRDDKTGKQVGGILADVPKTSTPIRWCPK